MARMCAAQDARRANPVPPARPCARGAGRADRPGYAPVRNGTKNVTLRSSVPGFWTEPSAERTGSLLSRYAHAPWQRRRGAQP
jgi:hypothetical protein